jgi:hypothetical protein
MIPEKVFEKILVLGAGWRVQRVDYLELESKILHHRRGDPFPST